MSSKFICIVECKVQSKISLKTKLIPTRISMPAVNTKEKDKSNKVKIKKIDLSLDKTERWSP